MGIVVVDDPILYQISQDGIVQDENQGSQGGNLKDVDRYRGGYHETWTVFWITAHFLNAAAQLQEMGVAIWED